MTNEKLCCDQEHALLLKETGLMKDCDIGADGYWEKNKHGEIYYHPTLTVGYALLNMVATYRLDKILAKLPKFTMKQLVFDNGDYIAAALCNKNISISISPEIHKLVNMLRSGFMESPQAAANAAAKLLHLLWKENLL